MIPSGNKIGSSDTIVVSTIAIWASTPSLTRRQLTPPGIPRRPVIMAVLLAPEKRIADVVKQLVEGMVGGGQREPQLLLEESCRKRRA